MEPYILEPMTGSYNDWTGSAAAEDSMIMGSGDLYELAGLNHKDWSIVAVEVDTFSHGKPSNWTVRVFAFDRRANDASNYEELKALEDREGAIPVTDILLHDVDLEDVVRCMKYIGFRIENPNFRKYQVVAKSDFPLQD